MKNTSWKRVIRRSLPATAFLAVIGIYSAGPAWAGQLSYEVTIDTSAINGTSGYLDLQFNPGTLPGTQLATAVVEGFTSDGTLAIGPLSGVTGDVTGTLPGAVSFDNQTVFNDDFEGITFGNSIQFELVLSGPAVLTPDGVSTSGSTFGVGLWDSTGSIPLLTSDPNGFVGTVDINLDGSGTTTNFLTDAGGPAVVTFTPETPTVTPEPDSILLFGTGLAAIIGFVRRRFRA